MKKEQIVQLDEITKEFIDGDQRHRVLDKLGLTLFRGDTVALTGASGSGKSTLLNVIAGFEPPSSGQLALLGNNTQHWLDKRWSQFRHQNLGVVFQQLNLLTPLNVADNIAFPLQLNNLEWNDWCDHLTNRLGLKALLGRHVENLSGGQQQRVAIARALAHKPELLLADEPTGNLDQTASVEVMELLCELAAENNTSILLVTHSQTCAGFMNRHWHLEQGNIHE
ncbi:ABC transporter ATP-binding protein [Vibrio sp. DW001]|uniref:ABC transporter ATP-binding protein n=1 Tax=Vibrio sp. DW001 TaxID=2912315 RepID=UPI0023AEA89F|nr:ABC transporter ATP-binding protein [Vibrio sp. DW001]WED25501.1 ABC transporter ATP-binding protein [Vibrio sp. DW001]